MISRAAAWACAATILASAPRARADDDDTEPKAGQVVYAKGTSLWRIAATGRGKTVELVALPAGAKGSDVRAIRTDPGRHVLIVDVAGTWYWSALDGDAAAPLAAIGCGAGPATLSLDGTLVVCAGDKGGTSVKKLGADDRVDRDVPAAGAVVTGQRGARTLVWADGTSVWSAPLGPATAGKALADAPLAHFSASPDGAHALGVYKAGDDKDAQLLYTFPLDGSGARRKVIRNGVPIEWSWDAQWVLVQDGGAACVMRAVGGEYKCWKGYTAVGVADDGAWALMLGSRDGKAPADPSEKSKSKDKHKGKGKHHDDEPAPTPTPAGEESESADAGDDTPVPLPKGPYSLYRGRRDGAYTDKPVVIVHEIDGAAAWLPAPPAK
jgi:hypothetical protein